MKRAFLLILTCLILLPVSAEAQKKRRTSTKKPATSATGKAATQPTVRSGAERVAEQIKVLSKFLYLLGGVSKGIETADAAVQRGEASQSVIDQTRSSKTVVRNSIKSLREQLDELEIDFRLKPELQPYYTKLAGVAAGAATAEDEAAAGQFDRSGRTLLTVINRLADVLLEMR